MESMRGKGGIASEQQHELGSGTWLNLGVSEALLDGGKRGGMILSPVYIPGFKEPQSFRYILKKVSRKRKLFQGKNVEE